MEAGITAFHDMDWQRIISNLEKLVPLALITGLMADWLRLRFAHRVEEKKHIAPAIADLLQLRFIALSLPEFPKQAAALVPEEFRSEIPPEFWGFIDFAQLLPIDEDLPKRYLRAVEEIAGFRPVLAFQLRDKERYLDLRKVVSKHFSQSPGSPLVANKMTEAIDREAVTALEETLALLARAHGIRMRLSIAYTCRRRRVAARDLIPPEVKRTFHEQIRTVAAAAKAQAAKHSRQPDKPSSP